MPPSPYTVDGKLVIKEVFAEEAFFAEEDGVYMPFWYFQKLFDYIVDTQAAQGIE